MEKVVNGKKLIDETGNRYGKLVVIERIGTKEYPSGQKKPIWLCQCDCGNTTEAFGQSLRAGQYKSCGCAKLELRRDWTGVKQGKLTIESRAEDKITSSGSKAIRWNCVCECGSSVVLRSSALASGSSHCGCVVVQRKIKHGHTVNEEHTPTFTSWHAMIQRCRNPNNHAYPEYGAKGIAFQESWSSFENFLEDMGLRPEGTSLNRINGAKIYSKETCEWATLAVQAYDQKKRVTNKSGKTGVAWDKRLSKWEAYISVEKKKISLGLYVDLQDAIKAREEAELKYYGWNKE